MPATIEHRPDSWAFASNRFARAVIEARHRLGWSTRELARRSGLSQPYIVALERARSAERAPGPTPTVDVVVRLASALGLDAVALFTAGLRPVGRHVFMVVDESSPATILHAQRASNSTTTTWISVGSPIESTPRQATDLHAIQLRRTIDGHYHPQTVAESLTAELHALRHAIGGAEIGLVFADTSKVMTSLDDPDTITRFEHRWATVVDQAAAAAEAHAAWNVCVYEIDALRSLSDPVAATLDLMRSHDATWSARRSRVTTGVEASTTVLERLRPTGAKTAEWNIIARELAAGIRPAA